VAKATLNFAKTSRSCNDDAEGGLYSQSLAAVDRQRDVRYVTAVIDLTTLIFCQAAASLVSCPASIIAH